MIHHDFSMLLSFQSDKNFVPIINIMIYIPNTDGYKEALTDKLVKDFLAINFSRSMTEKKI